jgi:hypothetical protein
VSRDRRARVRTLVGARLDIELGADAGRVGSKPTPPGALNASAWPAALDTNCSDACSTIGDRRP